MSLHAVASSPRAHDYRARHLLMCRPKYFAVSYEINPWMDTDVAVDRRRAVRQWERLVRIYRDLGHTVEVIEPVLGLPDMVFAANSAVVVDGSVYLAKFLYPQRQGEEDPYAAWFAEHGFPTVHEPAFVNEGEGDFAVVGEVVLAGYGFRTDRAAHHEAANRLGVPVLSLHLVDPRFYHLDTALTVLGDTDVAYFPGAFDAKSRRLLETRFPDAVIVSEPDALAFGCNAMSDGYHVVVPAQATGFIDALRDRGYEPVPVDMSEFRKAGGSVKCCTLELREARPVASTIAMPSPLELEQQHAARNYKPLPVTLTRGEGSWVFDAEGRRYLDMLCAYSALNFGHRHPALVAAAHEQLDKLTLTSRAFSNDQLGPYCAELTALCGKEAAVLMNTGAEAVETAIKVARRWGYERKGITPNAATIIVFDGNFHGRTTTIVSFSSDPDSRDGFGPFTPGFRRVPYGDLDAVANAIDDTVTAVLVEPIQGESGVVIPPAGFMSGLRDLCRTYNVLLVADEIQSGFGRTGSLFACDHDDVIPDMYVLGKALGGGIMPLSAVVANWDVLDVLTPGSHGSTFGGNPLACAVGLAVIELIRDGSIFRRAASIETELRAGLLSLLGHGVDAVRTRGAWAGIDLDPRVGTARSVAEDLIGRGVLSKDTHGQTLRLSPPLTISDADLSWGLDRFVESVASPASMSADAALADEAVALATELLETASRLESRKQRRHRRRLAGMLADEESRHFSLDLADEVLRIHGARRSARRLRELVRVGLPPFLGAADRAMLRVGAVVSAVAPWFVMPLVEARVKRETAGVLLPAEEPALGRHIARCDHDHAHLNVNLLGEAILGENVARQRVADVVDLLERPHIDYVSVKISSICSQIDPLAFDQTVARVAERLRVLFRVAQKTIPAKFVNLDMEEYRDLHLTIAAFTRVLDEDEFASLDAGLVLQAYLPDSYWALIEVCEWARQRHERGGGRIKIRIVKGANLAMETVDAEMHGWPAAPFANKADVDANYKRMLDVVLDAKYASAVRVGVASHNLFDVAWALTLRRHRGAEERVEIEMLEGMAPPQSMAAANEAGGVLLYGPVAKRHDLESAVAYLARRLDENAAPDNFLHALFSMEPGSPSFERERQRFLRSVSVRHLPPPRPRRHPARRAPHEHEPSEFFNEPDTDFTSAVNRRWITDELAHWHHSCGSRHATPTVADVDAAVERAAAAAVAWRARPTSERSAILRRIAHEMHVARGDTIAAMAHTAAKTVTEGDTEVSEAIDFARYYASSLATVDELRTRGAAFDPYRVTVVASPWNFPYAIPAGGVLAALAAGSAVILKPAPETRVIGAMVVAQCRRGGVPDDVVQFLPCDDDDAGRRLITHEAVDAVVLTGAWDTARLFRSWKPQLALHAETSGKNAIVVTAAADYDAAVRDIVRSAFGHAGQKCSAASLAILEAPVYDDARFVERLVDAVRSLRVGPATDLDSTMGPLVQPAGGALLRAFTQLDDGEEWLVEPAQLDERLWTPGVKRGVVNGSWFHTAECFGPVLGLMRADSLAHAITLQNGTPFGLTAGIQSLDPAEIEFWEDRVDAGNLYVNRAITGAIVRRQPFGGWKRSAMGPGAKAGGPNYVLSMGRWTDRPTLEAARDSYLTAWHEHVFVGHDPSGLRAESNVFRYVPYDRPIVVRPGRLTTATELELCHLAAETVAATLLVSRDDEADFIARLTAINPSKVRVLGRASDALYAACDELGVALDNAPVTSVGRLELLHWVREQNVSETRHRYGNLMRSRSRDAQASNR